MENKKINVAVRLVMTKGDKILLTQVKNSSFYFLPGGGLEFGESIEKSIKRELREELGINPKNYSFIGINETKFTDKSGNHHGIDLVFKVKTNELHAKSKENHIVFSFQKIKELPKLNILPASLKKSLIRWFKNDKHFWGKT